MIARRPRSVLAPDDRAVGVADDVSETRQEAFEVELPVLPLRGETLYPIPESLSPFLVARERSVAAIEDALARDRRILVIAQRNPDTEDVAFADLHEVGTEASITRMLKLPDGTTSVLVEGLRRVRSIKTTAEQPFLRVVGRVIEDVKASSAVAQKHMPEVLSLFEKVVQLNDSIADDVYVRAMNVESPGQLADVVAAALEISPEGHQDLLECFDVVERLAQVRTVLEEEIRVLELEQEIRASVREDIDADQRNYFLREQLRVIMKELGDSSAQDADVARMRARLESGAYPSAVVERGLKEIDRLSAMPQGSPEISLIRTFLEWLTELPWRRRTRDKADIERAACVLDAHHHGLRKVKDRLLEYIAVRQLSRRSPTPILCFVGPPGVGKTSLGQSIAKALSRRFVRVSLGGVRDEAEIRGHRMTYIGSMPGRVLQKMREAGTLNPVFMIDEIDKLGIDFRGDPAAALLEVLDPEQNHAFSDHYLEIPYNLSKVLFIATANTLEGLPPALVDRMEVIELPGYVEDEKRAIGRQFLVPRQLREHGLTDEALSFEPAAITRLIREYTREAGVRELERSIATIARKRALARAEGQERAWHVTAADVPSYLGPPRYMYGVAEEQDEVAIATAVFGTPAGGDLLPVEVSITPGDGEVTLTGSLGNVMKESAYAALSFARSHAEELGYGGVDFSKIHVHIHVPSGALPKDGPAAGIAVAAALVSALSERKVRHDVTMTGEITLRGRMLPVGGVRDKVLAAHRAGIRTFLLPHSNRQDLEELPDRVRKDLNFVLAATVSDALANALAPASQH